MPLYEFFLAIGGILLLSLATHTLGHHTWLPKVTLLIILGGLLGNSGLQLIPPSFTGQFELVTNIALMMVGFLLGGKMTLGSLRRTAALVLGVSVFAVLGTIAVVGVGLMMLGVPFPLALMFGCIAAATDPAATFAVAEEGDKNSRFVRVLMHVVSLDDIWALLAFGVGVVIAAAAAGSNGYSVFIHVVYELSGGALLGVALGIPSAYLTGRFRPGQPIFAEALGLVCLCGGLALYLGVSFILANIVLGMCIANLARHHDYPFHAIEDIEWPFMVVFFVLAGAQLDIDAINGAGMVGIGYVVLRVLGKWAGGAAGAKLAGGSTIEVTWVGLSLLPQAGVAIGLALLAGKVFPQYQQTLLSVVIASTVLFEIVGPLLTRLAINKAGLHEREGTISQ